MIGERTCPLIDRAPSSSPLQDSYGELAAFSIDTSGLYCMDDFVFSDSTGTSIEVDIAEKCALVQV